MKTVALSEETHRDLVQLKLVEKSSSTDELIHKLVIEHRKRKLLEASQKLRSIADQKGLTLKDIIKSGETIKKEVYEEWFGSSS